MLKHQPKAPQYICALCRELSGLDWGFKDTEEVRSCHLCKRLRRCRLSDLRVVSCSCHCPCKGCREVRKRQQH